MWQVWVWQVWFVCEGTPVKCALVPLMITCALCHVSAAVDPFGHNQPLPPLPPSPPLLSPPLLSVQIQRYNVLLKTIRSSLADLEKGIKGLVVMSADLEEVFTCIYNAQVPALWSKVLHRRPCGVQLTCTEGKALNKQSICDK